MPNAPIANPKRPDIEATKCNTRGVTLIEVSAREPERELSSPPSGVLRELALAQWRGSATQVPRPPQRTMMKTGERT
jgi:hypothetical protein